MRRYGYGDCGPAPSLDALGGVPCIQCELYTRHDTDASLYRKTIESVLIPREPSGEPGDS